VLKIYDKDKKQQLYYNIQNRTCSFIIPSYLQVSLPLTRDLRTVRIFKFWSGAWFVGNDTVRPYCCR